MGRRANKKGRSVTGPRFLMLHHYMMETAAWLSSSPAERAVYLEIARLYTGQNNGRLALATRTAAQRCNINRETAGRCLKALQDRGLIECATAGGFSRKTRHAPEWRLTNERCDVTGALPSKAFLRWRPVAPKSSHSDLDHGPEIGPALAPKSSHSGARDRPSGRNEGPDSGGMDQSTGRIQGPHIDIPMPPSSPLSGSGGRFDGAKIDGAASPDSSSSGLSEGTDNGPDGAPDGGLEAWAR